MDLLLFRKVVLKLSVEQEANKDIKVKKINPISSELDIYNQSAKKQLKS